MCQVYLSSVEPNISLSLEKPRCNTSRVDIKPDKGNKNHINVVQGYTNSGVWNITSVFPVLSYLSLRHPYDTFKMPPQPRILYSLLASSRCPISHYNRKKKFVQSMLLGISLMPLTIGLAYLFSDLDCSSETGHFSFLTVATNTTKKNAELTQVRDKNCVGTVMIS